MDRDSYLRDLFTTMLEVDSDSKVNCSAQTMRGEVEVGWEIISQIHLLGSENSLYQHFKWMQKMLKERRPLENPWRGGSLRTVSRKE